MGLIVWFAVAYHSIKSKIQTLEQQGVYRPTPSQPPPYPLVWIALISTAGVLLFLLIFFTAEYLPLWLLAFDFFMPTLPALTIVPAVYGWLWQRRNKRTLYLAGAVLYPYPYINIAQDKETIY